MIYRSIADKMIQKVSLNFNLDMQYREIYVYSLERYLSNIFSFLLFGIVAIIFQIPLETIVFALFYGPLRKYAGGIHVKSRGLCMILSVAIMLVVICLSKWISHMPSWRVIATIVLAFAIILILLLAPVDSPRRRLSIETKALYRKRIRRILRLETIILLLGFAIFDVWSSFVVLGVLVMFLEGIFLIPKQ